ncbi:hypothetical protein, partial [Cellulomonas triticagri]
TAALLARPVGVLAGVALLAVAAAAGVRWLGRDDPAPVDGEPVDLGAGAAALVVAVGVVATSTLLARWTRIAVASALLPDDAAARARHREIDAWRLSGERQRSGSVWAVVGVLAGAGVAAWLARPGLGTPDTAGQDVAGSVVLPVVALLVAGGLGVAAGAALVAAAVGDIHRVRWDRVPSPPLPGAERRAPAVVTVGVAAVAVAALVLPGAVVAAANPWGLARTSVVAASAGSGAVRVVPLGDDVLRSQSQSDWSVGWQRLDVCGDDGCAPRSSAQVPYPSAVVGTADGEGVLSVGWRSDAASRDDVTDRTQLHLELVTGWQPAADPDAYRVGPLPTALEPGAPRVLRSTPLVVTSDPVPGDPQTEPVRTVADYPEMPVAMALADDGTVVVATAVARTGLPVEVVVLRCDAATCTEDRTVLDLVGPLPDDPLDVAVAPDGTTYTVLAGADVADGVGDGWDVLLVGDGSGALVERVRRPGVGVPDLVRRTQPGADVEVGPDGTPWVLFRDDVTATLLRCDDATCATSDEREIGQTVGPQGALAVDATGRPMVAAVSQFDRGVRLLSCRDAACSSVEERLLLEADVPPAGRRWAGPRTALALADGLPVLALSGDERGTEHLVVRCLDARCGAD